MEHRDLSSAWSFRRFIADEDPLFHKGFLERIFGSRRFSIDKHNLTWEGITTKTSRRNGLKRSTYLHKQTRHNEKVFEKVRRIVINNGRSRPQLNKTRYFLSTPSVTRIYGRERCRRLERGTGRTQKQFHIIAGPSNFSNA